MTAIQSIGRRNFLICLKNLPRPRLPRETPLKVVLLAGKPALALARWRALDEVPQLLNGLE
jgi:hypothetical protein